MNMSNALRDETIHGAADIEFVNGSNTTGTPQGLILAEVSKAKTSPESKTQITEATPKVTVTPTCESSGALTMGQKASTTVFKPRNTSKKDEDLYNDVDIESFNPKKKSPESATCTTTPDKTLSKTPRKKGSKTRKNSTPKSPLASTRNTGTVEQADSSRGVQLPCGFVRRDNVESVSNAESNGEEDASKDKTETEATENAAPN